MEKSPAYEAIEQLALMDDLAAIRALEYFHVELTGALRSSVSDLQAGLISPKAQSLFEVLAAREDETLSPIASATLARWLFVAACERHGLAPVVLRCLRDWPDDRHSVGKILSIGLVGMIWLTVATTEVTLKDGQFELHKRAMTPNEIEMGVEVLKSKLSVHVKDAAIPIASKLAP